MSACARDAGAISERLLASLGLRRPRGAPTRGWLLLRPVNPGEQYLDSSRRPRFRACQGRRGVGAHVFADARQPWGTPSRAATSSEGRLLPPGGPAREAVPCGVVSERMRIRVPANRKP
jgi:hypothetical protein